MEEEEWSTTRSASPYRAPSPTWTLNGYYMDFENEIVSTGIWDDDAGRVHRANAQSTIHKGLELALRWRLHPQHEVALAGSRSWNEYDRFTVTYAGQTEDHSGNPISLFPESMVSLRWLAHLGPVTTQWRLQHIGKQYLDNSGDDDRTIDPYTTVDLAVFADLGRLAGERLDGFEGFLRLNNVLDEEYETWGYYDAWENNYTPERRAELHGRGEL